MKYNVILSVNDTVIVKWKVFLFGWMKIYYTESKFEYIIFYFSDSLPIISVSDDSLHL